MRSLVHPTGRDNAAFWRRLSGTHDKYANAAGLCSQKQGINFRTLPKVASNMSFGHFLALYKDKHRIFMTDYR
jgi:hypothetical protein